MFEVRVSQHMYVWRVYCAYCMLLNVSRSRELETEILERKFVCQHVCALQREKIEAQFEEQIMKVGIN